MPQNSFFSMFVELLRDTFDAENQLVEALPKLASAASHPELKEAFNQHWDETKNQVQRLKQIFKTLNENPTGIKCQAMKGLIAEGQEALNKNYPPAVKDACLIIAAQKVEHYEIASYGSLRSLANHLGDTDLNDRIDFSEIVDLLQENLDEESAADEKLTDIADGGFFSKGINEEAEEEVRQQKKETQSTKQPGTRGRNK